MIASDLGFIDVYVKKEKFRNIGAVKVKPNDVRVSVSHEKFDAIQLECEGNLVVASCLKNLDNECVSEVANKVFMEIAH